MAKTRTVRLEGVVDDDPEELAAREQAELDDLNEEEDGDLFRVTDELRALGAGVQLLITRTYPNTPDMAGYVGEMTLAEYDAEEFYNRFGPGRYKVRLRGPKGLIKGGGSVHIAKRATAPPSGGAGVGDVASLLKVLNERDEARRKEESERRARWLELTIPAAITALPGVLSAMFGNRGPDITGLITALKPAPAPAPPSMTELTTALTNLKTLSGGDKDDSKLDTILKVMEFAKTLSGDGGEKGDSNWIDVIRDLLREGPAMIKPVLESMQAQQQSAIPAMQVTPVAIRANPAINANVPNADGISSPPGSAPDAAPSSATGETDMLALFMPMIRAHLAKLATWAVEKRRVELYAEVLLEELPATVHSYVTPQDALKYLQHEHWFEIITAPNMEPRLANYRDWCDAMRKELIDIIQEQLKKEADDSPPDFSEVEGA